jgi:hypothetical protein
MLQLTFTAGFGGGATSAVLLGHPDIVPINLFVGYTDVIFTLSWWIANYFPYNIPGRLLRTSLCTEITKLLLVVAVGRVMCNRVDMALKLYPNATIAALLIGMSSSNVQLQASLAAVLPADRCADLPKPRQCRFSRRMRRKNHQRYDPRWLSHRKGTR